MSSAAAVIGLTYRTTDIQDIDSIYLEIYRGLIDGREVRGQDLIVPALEGQVVRNRVAHRRSIGLRGWVRGVGASDEDDDRADFATNRAAFLTLFDETLEPGELSATLEDGSIQTISARALNLVINQVVPSFLEVDVELESVDPDWTVSGS